MPSLAVSPETRWFTIMDRLFWVLWVLLPLTAIGLLWIVNDPDTYTAGLTPEQSACMANLPLPPNYSTTGKLALGSIVAFNLVFYAVIMGILHRMIRRFAKGKQFDQHTLKSMQWFGIILIAFPFADMLLTNIVGYILTLTSDAGLFTTSFLVDIGPIAVGIFVLALMHVLKNAIALKTENDLTI
jgi:Protein of unknown function (DUF2975)